MSLKRGMYAKHTIPAGKTITADDVFLAMPCFEGQFHAGKYWEVVNSFTSMEPIYAHNLQLEGVVVAVIRLLG